MAQEMKNSEPRKRNKQLLLHINADSGRKTVAQ